MTRGRGRPTSSRKSLDRNRIEDPSSADVPHLKSEKSTQSYEYEALGAVDCEGPNPPSAPHRADISNHLIGPRTGHRNVVRVSRPQVDTGAIWAHHRVMRAGPPTIH
jgi:hypothetical protein